MTSSKSNHPKSSSSERLTVQPEEAGMRLDRFCAARIETLSRTQIQRLNSRGHIAVDGVARPDHYTVSLPETVMITLPPPAEHVLPMPQDIPIRIAYEDDDVVVVNKSADFVVHPAHGNPDGTLVNALLGRGTKLSALGGDDRPGIVHRLDKDTSGLMVVAKSDEAYRGLVQQIKDRQFKKIYHAVVWGNLGMARRTIDAPIARHPVQRQKMAVVKRGGREAITEVFVVDSFDHFDYIRVVTQTGRTHQIRVHLAHISHPILGDILYGGGRKKRLPSQARLRNHFGSLLDTMQRHALHATDLGFKHPVSGARLEFRTALPDDMRTVLEILHCWKQGG